MDNINENKSFINLASALEIEHQTLFTDQKFIDFHYQLETHATLKNYTTIFIRKMCIFRIYWTLDMEYSDSSGRCRPPYFVTSSFSV